MLSCYDPEYNFESFLLKYDCENFCKLECNENNYHIDIERFERSSLDNEFLIRHSEFPDIFVQFIPEMNLISFICNFGGLLGMWLGLTLFGIFNGILKKHEFLYYSFKYPN